MPAIDEQFQPAILRLEDLCLKSVLPEIDAVRLPDRCQVNGEGLTVMLVAGFHGLESPNNSSGIWFPVSAQMT